MSAPGLRLERLMFWSAPITLACLFVMFASMAYNNQTELLKARCHAKAESIIRTDIKKYQSLWEEEKQDKSYPWTKYHESVLSAFISSSGCWDILDESIKDEDYKLNPEALSNKLNEQSKTAKGKTVNYYGVEIPDKATINFFGTKVGIEFIVFIQSLQVALVPILAIWLGSIFQTRHREIMILLRTEDIAHTFPHILNVYPAGYLPSLRKRDFFAQHAEKFWGALYLFIRLLFLLIIIGPPIAFFLVGLYNTSTSTNFFIQFIIGFFLVITGLCIVIIEMTLYSKIFPGPTPLR